MLLICLGAGLGRFQTLARDRGQVDFFSSGVRIFISPLAMPAGRMFVHLSEFASGMIQARSLVAQNAALKAQLVGYQAYGERVDYLNEQIDSLRKLLALPLTSRKAVNLDVVGISLADGSLIVDGGTELGIKPDQAVVNGDGLVGIVQTVSRGECRVALLTAYGLKIFGVDSSRRPPEEGLISGDGTTLKMRMLNPKDPVASGDKILTTLKSKNIPGGLVVGRVISVEEDPDYGTRSLSLDPAFNLGTIHEVQVLE